MPMEFECRDIGNQNCGFKAEANTQEELVAKVNQHVRSAHGMNPTDAQEKIERAMKEKEGGRGSSSRMTGIGSNTESTSSGQRNQDNQTRQPRDDQVITSKQGSSERGAMVQNERFSHSGNISRQESTGSDRYRPDNNPERNPEPLTGDEEEKSSTGQRSPTTSSPTTKNPQEKKKWE